MKKEKIWVHVGGIGVIIGLLVVIILPNLLSSIQRSKRSRTAADVRALGTELGSYLVGNNLYPSGDDWQKLLQDGNIELFQAFIRKAELQIMTTQFDHDKEQLYATLKEFEATIKVEKLSGAQPPSRQLTLRVAVKIQQFDEIIVALKTIGTLTIFSQETIDKTDDFRNVLTQQQALEAHREALQHFRDREGTIEELIRLEEKLFDVEQQIHQLGVQLGTFVQKESFANIDVFLVEHTRQGMSLSVYLYGFVACLLMLVLFVYVMRVVLKKSSA